MYLKKYFYRCEAMIVRSLINVDIQIRTNVPRIFAISEFVGQPMLARKAVHEAHKGAEVIAGELHCTKELAAAAINARVIPGVAYTDPEVAWVGTHAGDMIGEIALAIEMGADAVDNGKTIHLQPKLGESIGMAAALAYRSCKDFPPTKK